MQRSGLNLRKKWWPDMTTGRFMYPGPKWTSALLRRAVTESLQGNKAPSSEKANLI